MHKVFVYSNGALLGYGFVIMYADGKMSAPELFDIGGNRLPENAWYEIQMSDEKYSVIVPRNIQQEITNGKTMDRRYGGNFGIWWFI